MLIDIDVSQLETFNRTSMESKPLGTVHVVRASTF